jgi:hypothetical protein
MGLPRVTFELDEGMGRGEFKIDASLAADEDVPGPRVSTREPDEKDAGAAHALSSDTATRLGVAGSGAELIVLGEDGSPKEKISITRAPVVIGRMSSNDVVLADSNVSRRHAELRRDGEHWVLVDLGSTNGTLVNGKLAKEHSLSDGDRLSFGTSELLFKSAKGA